MTKGDWTYLKYILRHKWYVFIECCKEGMIWTGIVHDLSKLSKQEFKPYSKFFYNDDGSFKHIVPGKLTHPDDPEFEIAVELHYLNNPHHPEYWLDFNDNGEEVPVPMSKKARKEMLSDWKAAGKAKKNPMSTLDWYKANKDKLILHPSTRKWVEEKLGYKE